MFKAIFRNNLWFFIPYLFVLSIGLAHLTIAPKGFLEKTIDKIAFPALDRFFVFYTHIGDGWFAVFTILIFLFLNRRQAFTLAIGMVSCGIVSQLLKHSIGKEALRPARFFENEYLFRDIEYLSRHFNNSMPSGHTAAAFCLFMMLTLFSEKKIYGYVFFLLAALAGLSRIWLAQHFLEDVIVGSLIGLTIGVSAYYLGSRLFNGTAMNRPLINFK